MNDLKSWAYKELKPYLSKDLEMTEVELREEVVSVIADLLEGAEAKDARIKELEEALRPFAKYAEHFNGRERSEWKDCHEAGYFVPPHSPQVTVGDYRRAVKALFKLNEGAGK